MPFRRENDSAAAGRRELSHTPPRVKGVPFPGLASRIRSVIDAKPTTPARIARFWPVASGVGVLLLVAALALLIFYRENNKPFGFELEWMGELVENRTGVLVNIALVFNALGGGLLAIIVIPIGIAAALVLWRRWWAALYFVIATVAGAALVQLVKQLLGRARPTDMLVMADPGSFPSGHSANAAVIAATLGIIFARTWVWAAGAIYTLAMMLSRTYLGAHWISDTIGGALIGLGVAIIVWAPFAAKLNRERHAPHPPLWRKLTDGSGPADREPASRLTRR